MYLNSKLVVSGVTLEADSALWPLYGIFVFFIQARAEFERERTNFLTDCPAKEYSMTSNKILLIRQWGQLPPQRDGGGTP
jgi:hypothetical protein